MYDDETPRELDARGHGSILTTCRCGRQFYGNGLRQYCDACLKIHQGGEYLGATIENEWATFLAGKLYQGGIS